MKKIILSALLFMAPAALLAQTSAVTGFCTQGATQATISGTKSANYQQGIVPFCNVTVYDTGTVNLATIYSDAGNTPLSSTFTATQKGQWTFWASTSACYDIQFTGGVPPNTFVTPITLTDVCPGGGGGVVGVTSWNTRTGAVTLTTADVTALGLLVNSTSGNAATATALAGTPSLCSTGNAPTGILANGNATGCAAIAGGGGLSGQTAGYAVKAATGTTATAPFPMDDSISAANTVTVHKSLAVDDGSGVGAGFKSATEGTVPPPGAGYETFYADSSSHRWKFNPNNAGAFFMPGMATPLQAGHLFQAGANGIDVLDGGQIATQPSLATLITDYDFHDGSGTTVTDVSGHGNNMTFTSGTPGGTTAPRWMTNPSNGIGVGIAMGSDSLGSYGLPTVGGGTSCETVPVLQNAARTVLIQYFNPPTGTDGTQSGLVTYTNTFAIQDWLGSSNPALGYDFSSYQWVMPLVVDNTGGNLLWSNDNMVGFHTDIIVFSNSGASVIYHDGQTIPAYYVQGAPSLSAVNWVLGCNGVTQAGGDQPTAPSFVFRLSFWSNALNPIEAQQAYGFVTNNLLTTKGFQPQIVPPQLSKNQYVALGDSQTEGTPAGGGSTLYPFAFCSVTANCYGTTYPTVLSNFGGPGWFEASYGLPGAGVDSLPAQVASGLAKLRGDSNLLHLASILIGTNGFGKAPCAAVQNLKQAGWDVWVQLLFSLSNVPATDQANRDPYNFSELQSSFQCGATGIIDTSADGYIGADGTNGTAPPGGVGGPGVHLTPSGYAWLMSINARVFNAYYQANPSVPTIYSAATVTMNGQDRYTTFNTGSNAITAHLPDCIGMVAMPYYFTVNGNNTVTLNPAVVSGQTETINGTSSYVMAANSVYKFLATTRATATTAPGGCNWQPAITPGTGGGGGITQLTGDVTAGPGSGSQVATAANTAVTPGSYTSANITVDAKGRVTSAANGSGGIGGSGTNGKLSMFTASSTIGDAPISVSGPEVSLDGSYYLHANRFKGDVAYHSCGDATFVTPDGGGISADSSIFYLCGFGGTQVAHSTGANLLMDTPLNAKVYTVSTLPSAATAGAGAMVAVSDSNTFTPGSCVAGGSDYMIAVSNGSTWSCH